MFQLVSQGLYFFRPPSPFAPTSNSFIVRLHCYFKLKFADEGNWRNDYPDDEGQWSDSSQDRKYYEDYGFDSGELIYQKLFCL